jgi:cell division protein FtsB
MDLRVGVLPKIRVIPGRQAGLRTLVERAPEAEAFADRLLEKSRPAMAWFYGVRRKGATIAVFAIAAWLFAHVMFGANGMVVYRQKRTEFKNLQTDINSLQKENDAYTKQINSLTNDPKAIEKEARETLQYTRPGEYVYVSPPPASPQPVRTKSARK